MCQNECVQTSNNVGSIFILSWFSHCLKINQNLTNLTRIWSRYKFCFGIVPVIYIERNQNCPIKSQFFMYYCFFFFKKWSSIFYEMEKNRGLFISFMFHCVEWSNIFIVIWHVCALSTIINENNTKYLSEFVIWVARNIFSAVALNE